jgi:hypothetical protein
LHEPGPRKAAQGITFPVDDVKPAGKALPVDALGKAFANRSGRTIVAMKEYDQPVVASPVVDNPRMHRALNGQHLPDSGQASNRPPPPGRASGRR